MFMSALIDVAGHAKKLEAAFDILQQARKEGVQIGIMTYSSLMGACSKVCMFGQVKCIKEKPNQNWRTGK
jgi:pentatricopeptide repeat protein